MLWVGLCALLAAQEASEPEAAPADDGELSELEPPETTPDTLPETVPAPSPETTRAAPATEPPTPRRLRLWRPPLARVMALLGQTLPPAALSLLVAPALSTAAVMTWIGFVVLAALAASVVGAPSGAAAPYLLAPFLVGLGLAPLVAVGSVVSALLLALTATSSFVLAGWLPWARDDDRLPARMKRLLTFQSVAVVPLALAMLVLIVASGFAIVAAPAFVSEAVAFFGMCTTCPRSDTPYLGFVVWLLAGSIAIALAGAIWVLAWALAPALGLMGAALVSLRARSMNEDSR